MNNTRIKRILFFIIGCVAVFSINAFAALDNYTITAPANMMKGDTYTIRVEAFHENGTPYLSGHLIKFILPPGVVCTGGDTVSISNGEGTYTLSIGAAAVPGPGQRIRVHKEDDANINGDAFVAIEDQVRGFDIQIPVPGVQTTGVEFDMVVRAIDSTGSTVKGFKGNVDISAAIGNITVTQGGNGFQTIYGTTFSTGIANISIVLYGTFGSSNTVTMQSQDSYIYGRAIGSKNISIEPNNFNHVLLLFPGEKLEQGTGMGKSGSPATVTAGALVDGIDVYLVDQWNNPILTTDPVFAGGNTIDVTFTKNNWEPTDTLPSPVTFNGANHVHIVGDPFIFTLSELVHTVTATEDEYGTSNVSNINVQHNTAAEFRITDCALTQSSIAHLEASNAFIEQITIEAIDNYGNVDIAYNGIANIFVNVTSGAGTIDTEAVHVNPTFNGSFPYLNAPDNTITLTSGRWTGEILISKAHDSVPSDRVRLYVLSSDLSKEGYSNEFYLMRGAVSNLWFELPQERYTEGYYPGNDPLNPPKTFTAGDIMDPFIVYAVDRSWDQTSVGSQAEVEIVPLTGYIDVPPAQNIQAPGSGTINGIQLLTASNAMRLRATIIENPHPYRDTQGISNPFIVLPSLFDQVVMCAPEQLLEPGLGKTGTIIEQRVHQPFEVTAYLTDQYFNAVTEPGTGWPTMEFYVKTPSGGSFVIDGAPFTPADSEVTRIFSFTELGAYQIKFQQQADPTKFDVITVNVINGAVAYFTIDGVQNKQAGDPFSITVTAYDAYGFIAEDFLGQVDLTLLSDGTPITYAGAIQPAIANFTNTVIDRGKAFVNVAVNFAGVSMGAGSDHLRIKVSIHNPTEKFGLSNEFDIYENAFSDIVLILTGEVYQPGGIPVKINTAHSVTGGNSINLQIFAVDNMGNRVNYNGTVDLSLTDPEAYVDFNGVTQLTAGYVQKNISIYTAGNHTVDAIETASSFNDSSSITIYPGLYSDPQGKILLLADGEVHKPGSTMGKVGVPTSTQAYTELILTILTTDEFYNIDTNYTGGTITLTSDDAAIDTTGISVNKGLTTVSGLYLRGGEHLTTVRITAVNEQNHASFSDIAVNPGAYFEITVSTNVVSRDLFPVTVRLIDPQTGNPGNFNHDIYFEAVKEAPDNSPATLPIGISNAVLVNGVVTLNQFYSHVEVIRIKVTDNFNRLMYSENITVKPSNLTYLVEYPPQGNTDQTFNMSVKLYDTKDTGYNNVITNMDHVVSLSLFNGGGGILKEHHVRLDQGQVQFVQQYTRAESIIIKASGTINGYYAESTGNTITILPGAYSHTQIIAPGEIPVPGVSSPTGKDSTNIQTQAAKQTFTITVYAVDMYWNKIDTIGSGTNVRLTASDGSLDNFPLTSFDQGRAIVDVKVNLPPSVDITAEDAAGGIVPQTVTIPLTGRGYRIFCYPNYPPLNPNKFVTGKDFDIIVYLLRYDPSGAETEIVDPTAFYLIPMDKNLDLLDETNIIPVASPTQFDTTYPVRFVTKPPVLGGGTRYTIKYKVAEDVIFKIYDDDGWIGYSVTTDTFKTKAIHFEPEKIYYQLELPEEAIVGPPETFTMKIIPRDINTDTIPINFESEVNISVSNISNPTHQYDGSILVPYTKVNGGEFEFEQAFTRYGIITFKVQDIYDETVYGEAQIKLHAGPMARFDADIPKSIEAGTTREITVFFYDQYDNPVKDIPATLSLDDDLLNHNLGSLNVMTLQSNSLGISTARLSTIKGFSGSLFFTATVGELSMHEIIKVLGPPDTTLFFGGLARDTFKGHSLKQTDPIILEADYDEELTLERVMYRIDDGEWLEYTGPFTISEVGIHTVEYYSVTVGELEHEENHKHSLKVFITQATTPDEGLVNYPNPFMAGKESTFLEYYLVQNSNVTLSVYDLLGQKVYERDILAGQMGGVAGLNRIEWDGRNSDTRVIANGGYIAILDIKDEGRTLKRKIAVRK